jgi:hypothetical protein
MPEIGHITEMKDIDEQCPGFQKYFGVKGACNACARSIVTVEETARLW